LIEALRLLPSECAPEPGATSVVAPPPDASVGLAPAALLRLLQLASPALPIGAFAYSQGLEMALELGLLHDEASARDFAAGVLLDGLARLELPLLIRLHGAFERGERGLAERWSELLLASRETAERREEEQQLGRALARLLGDQGVPEAAAWHGSAVVTHLALFALAGAHFGVPLAALAPAFAFSWAEAQVSALSRLVPLGQLASQRVLAALAALVPEADRRARSLTDDEIGATLPALALASALHETQYTRLFRS
jgi:urease accessory protein